LGFSAGSVVSNVALSLSSTNATQTSLPFEFVHALDTTLAATAGSLSNDTMGLRVKADQQGTTDANRTQTPASFQVALNGSFSSSASTSASPMTFSLSLCRHSRM
jgi:hypothetical protein